MINICLGHAASGNRRDLISKDVFQPIAGNETASFLTNEEGRNFGSSPWGAIIIEARFSCCTCGGKTRPGLTYLIGHVKTTWLGPGGTGERLGNARYAERQVEHAPLPDMPCQDQTSARLYEHVGSMEQK